MDKRKFLFGRQGKKVTGSMEGVLFIDPGLGGTGWAFFNAITKNKKSVQKPLASGVYRASKKQGWQTASTSLCSLVGGAIQAFEAKNVVVEMPELWGGSALSYASATHKASPDEPGDLFKLAYLVGAISQEAVKLTGNQLILISPMDWKGQLPKDVVIKRIKEQVGEMILRDHEADAVGMGVSAQGKL